MNIGGSKKQITASMDAAPSDIADRFINDHGIDGSLHGTLAQMIEDQINRIKASASEVAGPATEHGPDSAVYA